MCGGGGGVQLNEAAAARDKKIEADQQLSTEFAIPVRTALRYNWYI
jgi:hypothetical protein